MKNVTISMDETTLAWVRVEAAKAGASVSSWIAGRLEADRRLGHGFARADAAIEAILAQPLAPLSENGRIFDRQALYNEMIDERFRRFDRPAVPDGLAGAEQGQDMRGVAEDAPPFDAPDPERSGSQ
ncbi:hypothetical protein [Brevundimonas sp.]|uniref:hypothetical protein n=1 Tax=Brevundimonas sp. TaxID=1871086 RepID=UPI003918CA79